MVVAESCLGGVCGSVHPPPTTERLTLFLAFANDWNLVMSRSCEFTSHFVICVGVWIRTSIMEGCMMEPLGFLSVEYVWRG